MKENIIFFADNYCYFQNQKDGKLFKISFLKNTLKNGKISNTDKFTKEFYKFLNNQHYINIFLDKKMTCIINPSYTEADKKVLIDTLEKLNFNNIKLVNELKIINLNNNNYINYNKDYLLIYFKDKYKNKKYRIIETNFFSKESDLYNYINNLLGKESIYLYGEKANLDLLETLNKTINKDIYLINNSQDFILKEYTK